MDENVYGELQIIDETVKPLATKSDEWLWVRLIDTKFLAEAAANSILYNHVVMTKYLNNFDQDNYQKQ